MRARASTSTILIVLLLAGGGTPAQEKRREKKPAASGSIENSKKDSTRPAAARRPVKAADWYPLPLGAVWTYRSHGGKVVVTATGVETIGDVECVRLEARGGFGPDVEYVCVEKDGVYRHAAVRSEWTVEPPLRVLALPPLPAKSWKVNSKMRGVAFSGLLKTEAAEIEVPAGRFPAAACRSSEFTVDGKPVAVTSWYAPKIGLVKQEIDVEGRKITLELEKFERPQSTR